jgi:hypothetical protein
MNQAMVAGALCCVVGVTCAAGELSAKSSSVLIDDFNSIQNRLNGFRNTYQKSPSAAVAVRVPEARFGHRGLGLRLTADRRESGYCGVWIHFFDVRAHHHKYLDASNFSFLSFWVKGAIGGERFKIKLADDIWIAKEDSVAIGDIEEYLKGGVTTRWQQVRIPLDAKFGLNLQRLGGLTLDFATPGRSTVFLDQIEFESSSKANDVAMNGNLGGLSRQPGSPTQPGIGTRQQRTQSNRAIWLWTTETMLDDPRQAEEFFLFCKDHRIKYVWAQLPYQMKLQRKGSRIVNAECIIRRQSALRRFLQAAHAAGLQVHALEGYPEHAQRQYHHVSLAIVDAVLAFNETQTAADRFDGIHFDNEPYLLVGWHDPQRRKQILYEFLTLSSECQRRVRAASPRIEFGVDIPFWWQELDRHGEPHGVVTFKGTRQAASLHLLEMVDNVGVMNYRDVAQGADGMIAHARDLLTHADTANGVNVFLGVETCAYPPKQVLFAVGKPRPEFEQAVRGHATEVATLSRLDGNRLHVVADDEYVHVGIEAAEMDSVASRIKVAKTLSRVASAFGVGGEADRELASKLQDSLAQRLARDTEWSNVKPCSVRDPDTGEVHLLVKADSIVPSKITFADENAKQFKFQTELAEEQFAKHVSYAGLCIHHYRSFQDLMNRETRLHQPAPADHAPADHAPADTAPADNTITLTSAK